MPFVANRVGILNFIFYLLIYIWKNNLKKLLVIKYWSYILIAPAKLQIDSKIKDSSMKNMFTVAARVNHIYEEFLEKNFI